MFNSEQDVVYEFLSRASHQIEKFVVLIRSKTRESVDFIRTSISSPDNLIRSTLSPNNLIKSTLSYIVDLIRTQIKSESVLL